MINQIIKQHAYEFGLTQDETYTRTIIKVIQDRIAEDQSWLEGYEKALKDLETNKVFVDVMKAFNLSSIDEAKQMIEKLKGK